MYNFCVFFLMPCFLYCSQKHQAHLLPYLLSSSPLLPSTQPIQSEEWQLHTQLVLRFLLDPSQYVEGIAVHERASANATMLMKCSLQQLTPHVLFFVLFPSILNFAVTYAFKLNLHSSGFMLCSGSAAGVGTLGNRRK
jgi:hypothetical protein